MATATLFFGSNIRFLRERQKFSQEEISEVLDLSRNKLQALESGKTKNPTSLDLIKFSEYFKVSVDTLLKIDIGKLSELLIRELQAGNDVYVTGSKLRILSITVDKDNNQNMDYIPVKAKAGYRSGFADPKYLADLPKFSQPNLPKGHTYRMFPTTGDSMLPIPEGAEIICQFVQDWKSLKPETPCILVLKGEQDFVFKQVTIETDHILLQSLNPLYEPYTVESGEVLEIWKYYSFQSRELPPKESNMDQIMKVLLDVQKKVVQLEMKQENLK
jgi:transcriptional regulator with XRE-family HTH domain